MSNYMTYLLFVNPEMLLPGTRRNLFTTAYDELKDILRDNEHATAKMEGLIMQRVISTMQDKPKKASEEESKRSSQEKSGGGSKGSFTKDAWALAQGLLALRDDDKMWELIQGIWVEMLCFSASRCRGYLHAKALGSGGEFLTYVWLLMSCMGMETFTERLQREELPPASDARNGTASSTSEIHTRARAAPSTSQVHHTSASPSTDEICIDVS